MTTRYATFRENAARCPTVPCHLRPPLRELHCIEVGLIPDHKLPVIGDGRVYVVAKGLQASARDEGSWRQLWISTSPSGSPKALTTTHVVHYGHDLELLNPATGQVERHIGPGGLRVAAAANGLLVDCTEGLYCASLESEEMLWKVSLTQDLESGPPPYQFRGVFGVAEDRVVIGRDDGTIVAYALADGKELWGMDVTAINGATGEKMGVVQGAVVIWRDRALLEIWPWGTCALSVATGEVVWRWEGCVPLEAYLYDGRHYVLSQEGRLFVVDAADGRQLAATDLRCGLPRKAEKDTWGMIIEPLLVSETHVWVGSEGGAVVAFDRETLKYAWHGKPKKAASTHFQGNYFISVNGRLYWGDQTCGIHCFEEEKPTDPTLRAWRQEAKAEGRVKAAGRRSAVSNRRGAREAG